MFLIFYILNMSCSNEIKNRTLEKTSVYNEAVVYEKGSLEDLFMSILKDRQTISTIVEMIKSEEDFEEKELDKFFEKLIIADDNLFMSIWENIILPYAKVEREFRYFSARVFKRDYKCFLEFCQRKTVWEFILNKYFEIYQQNSKEYNKDLISPVFLYETDIYANIPNPEGYSGKGFLLIMQSGQDSDFNVGIRNFNENIITDFGSCLFDISVCIVPHIIVDLLKADYMSWFNTYIRCVKSTAKSENIFLNCSRYLFDSMLTFLLRVGVQERSEEKLNVLRYILDNHKGDVRLDREMKKLSEAGEKQKNYCFAEYAGLVCIENNEYIEFFEQALDIISDQMKLAKPSATVIPPKFKLNSLFRTSNGGKDIIEHPAFEIMEEHLIVKAAKCCKLEFILRFIQILSRMVDTDDKKATCLKAGFRIKFDSSINHRLSSEEQDQILKLVRDLFMPSEGYLKLKRDMTNEQVWGEINDF